MFLLGKKNLSKSEHISQALFFSALVFLQVFTFFKVLMYLSGGKTS